MKIITLIDNTAASEEMESRHGLCFYIETKNHKILFDMGPDETFVRNAQKLGVDLKAVDTAVLSHGHYDHGGGILAFLEINQKAKIHIQQKAFGMYYAHDPDGSWRYIGLPQELKENPRLEVHAGDYKLDAALQVFAGITGREYYSPANDSLFMAVGKRYIPDLFMHEQNLLIKEGNHMVLFAGCAHNGMVNILNKAKNYAPGGITHALGGMHLKNAYPTKEETEDFIKRLAKKLSQYSCVYYTCHCTGTEAYALLKKELKEQIQYLAAGSILEI